MASDTQEPVKNTVVLPLILLMIDKMVSQRVAKPAHSSLPGMLKALGQFAIKCSYCASVIILWHRSTYTAATVEMLTNDGRVLH